MSDWEIVRLTKKHDRSTFDCGESSLNDWLKERTGQFDRKDMARTFVATRSVDATVQGYYALVTHAVEPHVLPVDQAKGLPRQFVPVALLGRLAVDRSAQGTGVGSGLLLDALRRVVRVADQIGIRAIEVDALNDDAKAFYLKFGFRELLDDPRHLFMPPHEVRRLKLE
jgi:GNAT superfamily N-acetyltransferase